MAATSGRTYPITVSADEIKGEGESVNIIIKATMLNKAYQLVVSDFQSCQGTEPDLTDSGCRKYILKNIKTAESFYDKDEDSILIYIPLADTKMKFVLTRVQERRLDLEARIQLLEDKIAAMEYKPPPGLPSIELVPDIITHVHEYPKWATYDEFTKLEGFKYLKIGEWKSGKCVYGETKLRELEINIPGNGKTKCLWLCDLDEIPVIVASDSWSRRNWSDIVKVNMYISYVDYNTVSSDDGREYSLFSSSVHIDHANTRADRVQSYIPIRLHQYIERYIKGFIATEFRNLMWRTIEANVDIDIGSCKITIKASPPQIPPIRLRSTTPTTYIEHSFSVDVRFKIYGIV